MVKKGWKSEYRELKYSKIGSEISNMLENVSKSIACNIDALQGL